MKKKERPEISKAAQLRTGNVHPFGMLHDSLPMGGGQESIYRSMREAVPILDAAISKLVRLTGGFDVRCADPAAERGLRMFLRTVPTGRGQIGISSFLSAYLDSMLMYGRAIGEMVVSGGDLTAVCWGDVTKVQVQEGENCLDFSIGTYQNGRWKAFDYQDLLLFTVWNADSINPYGASMFRSMPFLTDILLKIYNTIGVNWERAGNVRYAVTYKPTGESDLSFAKERSEQIAHEWSTAMRESRQGAVRDFVAVGDVQIRVIGSDGQILDSQVPVRQILEQLVAKTGLPPFLLGLSWASTERMAAQQTDILTSEIWAIRRSVQPTLERICRLWLRLHGSGAEPEIIWDEISLQDIEAEAHAALYRAQAEKLMHEKEEAIQ